MSKKDGKNKTWENVDKAKKVVDETKGQVSDEQPQPPTSEEKPKLTPEQKAEIEKEMKRWEAFRKDLDENGDQPVTKADLKFALDGIFGDLQGLADVSGQAMTNTRALHQMIMPIMQMLSGGPAAGGPARTKGGIILPNGQ